MKSSHQAQAVIDEPSEGGARVDDFTIAYRIVRGMNADVFAVWHHDLCVPLICKRLRAEDAGDAKWRKLLRIEGAALARCNHPNIVRLIKQNQRARLPYILLEHVGGRTLAAQLLEERRFPVDLAVRIVQHTGAAVAYLHERGYIHRDLKPSNIILREGRPVLLDLGVVWAYAGGRRPPDCSGTPQYLAPEQIRRDPLSVRTDVFGLGCLLFELLTGERPFRPGADRRNRELPLVARYPQLAEEPLSVRRAGRRVSPKLQAIISRCLAPDPAARFSTVHELLVALDSFTRVKVWPRSALDGAQRAFSGFD